MMQSMAATPAYTTDKMMVHATKKYIDAAESINNSMWDNAKVNTPDGVSINANDNDTETYYELNDNAGVG